MLKMLNNEVSKLQCCDSITFDYPKMSITKARLHHYIDVKDFQYVIDEMNDALGDESRYFIYDDLEIIKISKFHDFDNDLSLYYEMKYRNVKYLFITDLVKECREFMLL